MTDESTDPDSVEKRLDTLEDRLDELEVTERLAAIEDEQAKLHADLEDVAETVREQGAEMSHVHSVEALYKRLETLEANIGAMRQSLEAVINEPTEQDKS